MEFVGFPKIPRLFRDIVITEKIDGTNAQVVIDFVDNPEAWEAENGVPILYTYCETLAGVGKIAIRAASRTRYITPEKDNQGFAKWVLANGCELAKLGAGRHFGEWWGQGIQRNYGLKEKRFSLFNVNKWSDSLARPACCGVVPVLWTGPFETDDVRNIMVDLAMNGSAAAPGFMKPEGIVVYHTQGNVLFKSTLENDEKGKTE